MKKDLLKASVALLFFCFQTSYAQVTLLSNNTDLTTGIVVNGKGLLLGDNDSLWVTNGTPAGTVKLTNAVSFVDSGGAALLNGKLLFSGNNTTNGAELWSTDGTAAGTVLIKDINPGASSSVPSNFVNYNNVVLFTADNGSNGIELWMSDGTPAGTVLLKDINAGSASSFTYVNDPMFTINNGILYFIANNGTNGNELWKTNGTAAGTTMVADLTAGSGSTSFTNLTTLGTNLIFTVKTGSDFTSNLQLWKSDGTSAGTTMLKDFGTLSGVFTPTFYLFNNKLYFNGTDYTNTGTELWVTDGTVAGTTLVKDINAGAASSSPTLFNATTINNKFIFSATTSTEGNELWISDGTNAGTQLLKDIYPGSSSSTPIIFKNFDFTSATGFSNSTLYNGKVFLSASDGTHGKELWITDGTSAGTVLVKDINPGSASGVTSSFSYIYTTSGLFFSANDGTSGSEPWLSNGTDAGTARIADVNPGSGSSSPSVVFFYNNQLYFNANNGDSTSTDLFKVDAPLIALPLTLLNFSASVQPTDAVKLDWTTTNEINTDHFEIERSIDGSHFTNIKNEIASYNSSMNTNYSYQDDGAGGLNTGALYYRLKLVDKDGSYKYSATLVVHFKATSLQFTFAPNPVHNQLNVIVTPAGARQVALRIIDNTGKQVYTQSIPAGQSVYQQNINVSHLSKGVYNIQLLTEDIVKSYQFLKQ